MKPKLSHYPPPSASTQKLHYTFSTKHKAAWSFCTGTCPICSGIIPCRQQEKVRKSQDELLRNLNNRISEQPMSTQIACSIQRFVLLYFFIFFIFVTFPFFLLFKIHILLNYHLLSSYLLCETKQLSNYSLTLIYTLIAPFVLMIWSVRSL